MNISEMVYMCKQIANEHGFYVTMDNVPTYLMLTVSELSEALEAWRDDNIVLFTEELADTMIRIAHICGDLNLPLEPTIRNKIEVNRKRPFKHGRKRL